jgi:hypothetical protein
MNNYLKFLLPVVLIVLLSCVKKDADKVVDNENLTAAAAVSEDENIAEPEVTATGYGYALRVNTDFFTMDNDTGSETDVTLWKGFIPLGEKVLIFGPARKATYKDKVYDYFKINWDEGLTDRYVWTNRFAEGGDLAVVSDEKANLYKSPRNVDVSNDILPIKTVLVYYPDTEKDGFVEIKAYDAAAQITRNSFIKVSSISRREADVQSSILLQTALALSAKETVRKDALLGIAIDEYPASIFATEILKLLKPVGLKETLASSGIFWVNDNNVNIRESPDEVSGGVVGQLSADTEVTISEETVNVYTVGGKTDKWYHIVSPINGWIFGSFLMK